MLPYAYKGKITANYCKTSSKSPKAVKFLFVANTCEPRHDVQKNSIQDKYMFMNTREWSEKAGWITLWNQQCLIM